MVWRGEQYERAIGLYYRKFGKYPTKIEDLTKQTNGVRFLRQAYKDPMNKDDGSWRFIYVGPNGQLIGSLRQISLLQTTLSTPGLIGPSALGGGLQPLSPPGAPGGTGTTTGMQPGTRVGQQGSRRILRRPRTPWNPNRSPSKELSWAEILSAWGARSRSLPSGFIWEAIPTSSGNLSGTRPGKSRFPARRQ